MSTRRSISRSLGSCSASALEMRETIDPAHKPVAACCSHLSDEATDALRMGGDERVWEGVVEQHRTVSANSWRETLEIAADAVVRVVSVDEQQVDVVCVHLDRPRVAADQLDVQTETFCKGLRLGIELLRFDSEYPSRLLSEIDRPHVSLRAHAGRERDCRSTASATDLDRGPGTHTTREPEDVSNLADRHPYDAVVQYRAGEQPGEVLELERAFRLEVERDRLEARAAVQSSPDDLEDALWVHLDEFVREPMPKPRRYRRDEPFERRPRYALRVNERRAERVGVDGVRYLPIETRSSVPEVLHAIALTRRRRFVTS